MEAGPDGAIGSTAGAGSGPGQGAGNSRNRNARDDVRLAGVGWKRPQEIEES